MTQAQFERRFSFDVSQILHVRLVMRNRNLGRDIRRNLDIAAFDMGAMLAASRRIPTDPNYLRDKE